MHLLESERYLHEDDADERVDRRGRVPVGPLPACVVAYRGPSLIDGSPIRAVLYSLRGGSLNKKTGRMAQLLIAPDEEPPHHAVRSGRDRSVCGDCTHRPSNNGTCYVVVSRFLPTVWEATSGKPADLGGAIQVLQRTKLPLRIGSWGDPAAVPMPVLLGLVDATRLGHALRYTAYTSAWRTCDQELKTIAMASVTSSMEHDEASALGWRTYRVRLADEPVLATEMVCPASAESWFRSTCVECLACSGARRRRDVTVVLSRVDAVHRR